MGGFYPNYLIPRRINPTLGFNESPCVPTGIRQSCSDVLRKLSDYLWKPSDGTDIGC